MLKNFVTVLYNQHQLHTETNKIILKEKIHFDADIAMYRPATTRVCIRYEGQPENQIRREMKGKPKLSIVK